MDCSLPGSSVHGILQARILEWIVMPSSRRSSQSRDQTQVSCIAGRFFTHCAMREAPYICSIYNTYKGGAREWRGWGSVQFSHSVMSDSLRSSPEYWSGYPFPSPGHLPNPGIEPRSLALQADSLPSEPPEKPKQWKTRIDHLGSSV